MVENLDQPEYNILIKLLYHENLGYDDLRSLMTIKDFNKILKIAENNRVLNRTLKKFMLIDTTLITNEQINLINDTLNSERKINNKILQIIDDASLSLIKNNVKFSIIKTIIDYPDIRGDIDILIERKNLYKAEKAILEMNIKPIEYSRGMWGLEYHEKRHFLFDLGPRKIDLELYPKFTLHGTDYISEKRVIDRSRETSIDGHNIMVPSPEDEILIYCVHGMYRHGGLINFHEVYNVSNILIKKSIDWNYLFKQAVEQKIDNALYLFLYVVNYFYFNYMGKLLLPDYVEKNLSIPITLRKSLGVTKLPIRVSILIIWYIFTVKFFYHIKDYELYNALTTIQECIYHTIGRAMRFTFSATGLYNLITYFGLN